MEYVYDHTQHKFPIPPRQQESPEPEKPPDPYIKPNGRFMFWCWFIGIHRFYVGKTWTGLLQFLVFWVYLFIYPEEGSSWTEVSISIASIYWGWAIIDFFLMKRWKIDISKLSSGSEIKGNPYSHKDKSTTLLLWKLGLHRIYVGKIGTGVFHFFTFASWLTLIFLETGIWFVDDIIYTVLGFFFIVWIIWALYDLVLISNNDFKDKRRRFICPK